MKRLFVFLAIVGLAFPVLADDLTTGTLEGIVAKEDGSPIGDAIVTAMGPQGVKTATTNNNGRFTIRGLPPGTYKVKAEAPGFGSMVQSEVGISIGSRTQLPFTLTAGVTEEVTVISQAPLVDLKSTTTGETITVDDFAPYVPLGRNLTSVFTIAPGVSDGGDPVLGSTNSSISGSSGLENAYFVDGVNITNSGYGAIGAYSIVYGSLGNGVTYDFLEEVQVKTGGFEAEFGQAGGGIVNTVVKNGSNDFGFTVSWYEEPSGFEGNRNDRTDVPNIANTVETDRSDISVTAGGPVIKDKLFYFGAYNIIETDQDFKLTSGDSSVGYDLDGDGTDESFFGVGETVVGGRVPASVTRTRSTDNYAGKVSWFATPNHKFDLTAFGDPSDGDVGPQSPTTFLRNLADPFAIPDPTTGATGLEYGGDQVTIKYSGVWTSNFFTEAQYAIKENEFVESGPGVMFRSIFDVDANAVTGGAGFYEQLSDEVDQIGIKNTHIIGPVEFSYGYQFEDIEWAQPRLRSGPTYTSYFPNFFEDGTGAAGFTSDCTDPTFGPGGTPNDPDCYTPLQSSTGASVDYEGSGTATTADDIYNVTRTVFTEVGQPTTAEETNFFAQATWDALPNLTIKAGLRYTEQELQGSGNETLPIGVLSNTGIASGTLSTTLTGQSYEFDGEIAPRIGVTWDVASNGKHKVYANWGEYYQRIPSDLAVRAFSNEVGTTADEFLDAALTMPALNQGNCGWDSNGDGTIDSSFAACHVPTDVQGLAGGGSIILDGTQLDPMSDVYAELGGLHTLTTGDATALPYTEEYLGGYAWEINDYSSLEVRYIHRQLGRVLEDVQFASNEQTWNLFFGESGFGSGFALSDPFPGHGAGAFGAYVFANVGDNVNSIIFPTPVRDYDAFEVIFNRRFNQGWMAYANYRWATLDGNYEGSFRNDNGQSDPFLTSLFDFPAFSSVDSDPLTDANGDGFADNDFDTFIRSDTLFGQYISGPLNTERTHILNGFVSKQFDMGLNVGGRLNIQTGQPYGPLFAHPTYRNAGEVPGFNPEYWWAVGVDTDILTDATMAATGCDPMEDTWCENGIPDDDFLNEGFITNSDATFDVDGLLTGDTSMDFDGDGNNDAITGEVSGPRLFSYDFVKRDFFGATPTIVTFDVHASYDIDLRGGQSKLTLLLDVFNLFNDTDAKRFDNAVETRPGSPNPDFLKPTQFQGPRNVRLGAKFTW